MSVADMSMLASMTAEQHRAVKAALCPGCRYDIPDTRNSDMAAFVHHLSEVGLEFKCLANKYREVAAAQV